MIARISWRNIWRNKGRSLVVIASIAAGIWSLIFMISFMNAFIIDYVKNQVNHETSHLQIHHPDFKTDYEIKFTIDKGEQLLKDIRALSDVKAVSARSICNGMISSPRKAQGIRISGVDPTDETAVNSIDSFIISGKYFEGVKRNPIVIGYRTAERLKVDVNSKVILTFQDLSGEIVSGAFRVAGIVHSPSLTFNDLTVLIRQSDLNNLLGTGESFHEIAVKLKSEQSGTDSLKNVIHGKYPDLFLEDWKQLSPELEFFQSSTATFLWILQLIVMIALVFGIINTMLMSVLERYRELGMLMAIGMNKRKVFSMVMLETLCLALVGSPLGLALSFLTMYYFKTHGIDLSAYSEGLEAYGYQNILHPFVYNETYYQVITGVFITSIAGAIYPAYKAVMLKPVEALHKIG